MLSFLVGTVTYQLLIRICGLDEKEHLCCSYWHTRMNWKTIWGLSPWTKKNVCSNKLSEWSGCPLKNRIWPYMQQESPQDKFSSPPSTKSASKVLNSAREVWEEDDIMLQMNDADTCSDQQSTDLLIVHQTHWQRKPLQKYGNEISLLDATYQTSRYALPLFFLCVKTNVNYCVVARDQAGNCWSTSCVTWVEPTMVTQILHDWLQWSRNKSDWRCFSAWVFLKCH